MKLEKVGKRRLEKLIQFMEEMPKVHYCHFDMGNWMKHTDGGLSRMPFHLNQFDRNGRVKAKALLDCGTLGCALGWATAVPALRKAGLRAVIYDARDATVAFICKEKPLPDLRLNAFAVNDYNVQVAAVFFRITNYFSRRLFMSPTAFDNRTPQQWAAYARMELADEEAQT